ncbi:MAG: regulator, partial [bacterium]
MKRLLSFFAIVVLLGAQSLQAQWIQTNGPYGGYILCFAVNGSNLFAGTFGGGVFLSTNNGTNWTAVNTGLTNTVVRSLAVN